MSAEQHRRFNLALRPTSQAINRACLELAQINLARRADGYLLGKNAHPHITLCQFQAPADRLSDVWSRIEQWDRSLFLFFDHVYILPGQSEHSGKIWVGFAITPNPELISLQQKAFYLLSGLGLTAYNPPETYFPHMTWGRCSSSTPFSIAVWTSPEIWQQSHEHYLTLGTSDENGVYLEQLFPT